MRVAVTGGCGYVGSVLVPKLLAAGHSVRVFDIQWFGNYLQPHPQLRVARYDIRESTLPLGDTDAIIHLAGVANDPTGDLDPKLTWEINALATMQLVDSAVRGGVKQFIYASSGSVYGVSGEPQVTEELPLVPLSEYNKTKMVAERVLLSYAGRIGIQILRPATVCGLSPRMRLDVVVNLLAMMALDKGIIKMNGGKQMRPNIHIEDMADLYIWMLDNPHLTGIYNAGFENLSVGEIAKMIADRTHVRTVALPVIDPRSYRLNSERLLSTGFKPRKTVANAIDEIIGKFRAGELKDETRWHNLLAMPRAA